MLIDSPQNHEWRVGNISQSFLTFVCAWLTYCWLNHESARSAISRSQSSRSQWHSFRERTREEIKTLQREEDGQKRNSSSETMRGVSCWNMRKGFSNSWSEETRRWSRATCLEILHSLPLLSTVEKHQSATILRPSMNKREAMVNKTKLYYLDEKL